MNRKPWIAGVVLLVLLMILCISGSVIAWKQWNRPQGSLGQRGPLPGFGYCSSTQVRPCILSFNLDAHGGMVINVLTNSLQDFYIKIKREQGERIYECRRVTQYSANVTCTGKAMPVGEILSFVLISKEKNTTLAQGNFPIVGVALATPVVRITPTPLLLDHSPR